LQKLEQLEVQFEQLMKKQSQELIEKKMQSQRRFTDLIANNLKNKLKDKRINQDSNQNHNEERKEMELNA